jgi:predicted ATPase
MSNNNLIILTGAPGVGKTSVLNELSKQFACMDEPAREVIADQKAINGDGVSDKNPKLFVELLLSLSIKKYEQSLKSKELVLFDRGVPDVISYAAWYEFDLSPFIKAAEKYRYNKFVFLLSPWEEIYKTDSDRKMNFKEVEKFHSSLEKFYNDLGYSIINVPNCSILDRVEFIKSEINRFN